MTATATAGTTPATPQPAWAEFDHNTTIGRTKALNRYRTSVQILGGPKFRSLSLCGQSAIPGRPATLSAGFESGKVSISGVRRCGSVWVCPVCAQRVTESRVTDLVAAVETWQAAGGSLALLTLTIPRDHGMTLEDVLRGPLRDAQAEWRDSVTMRTLRTSDTLVRAGRDHHQAVARGNGDDIELVPLPAGFGPTLRVGPPDRSRAGRANKAQRARESARSGCSKAIPVQLLPSVPVLLARLRHDRPLLHFQSIHLAVDLLLSPRAVFQPRKRIWLRRRLHAARQAINVVWRVHQVEPAPKRESATAYAARQRRSNGLIAGTVRALEATVGREAGSWHPHLHILVFLRRQIDPTQAGRLGHLLTTAWQKACVDAGLPMPSAAAQDCRVAVGAAEVFAAYAAKHSSGTDDGGRPGHLHKTTHKRLELRNSWAAESEIGKQVCKSSHAPNRFSPLDLLDHASNGEHWAIQRWMEWGHATKGQRQLVYSKGLKPLLRSLGWIDDDRSDTAIAEDPREAQPEAKITLLHPTDRELRVIHRAGMWAHALQVLESALYQVAWHVWPETARAVWDKLVAQARPRAEPDPPRIGPDLPPDWLPHEGNAFEHASQAA